MLRLLHTADWQIGRQYASFAADDAALLAEARFAAVARIAQRATEAGVAAVLVAGDVFDTQTASARTIHQLCHALAGFAGPWVMIPGNHDAALADSVWAHARRLNALPGNVHVALRSGVIALADLNLEVLCAPLTQRHTHDDLTTWFDGHASAPGVFRIGIAHGAVQGLLQESLDATNPIAPDRAATARLDYLALGDWHGAKQIDARCWYSGTPETDRFRNNDSGQVLIVEIDAPGAVPRVVAERIGQYRWQQLSPRLDVATDLDAVLAQLAALQAADVVELRLSGHIDLAAHQRLQAALAAASGRVRSLQADLAELRLTPTDEDIAALQADGFVGEVIAELREVPADDPQSARAQHALALLTGLLAERRADVRGDGGGDGRISGAST